MFRAIALTQWKWTRGVVLIATILGFAVPLASLQSARESLTALGFLGDMTPWGAAYGLLAAGLGLVVALAAWSNDQRGRHVYALSLPISRPRYVLLRLGAGALFLLPTIAAVLIAALVVTAIAKLPPGLHAYPVAITLRFALAAGVSYAIFFAIAASTTRTAGMLLASFAAVVLAQYVLNVVFSNNFQFFDKAMNFVFYQPGILSIFSGHWMLIDV